MCLNVIHHASIMMFHCSCKFSAPRLIIQLFFDTAFLLCLKFSILSLCNQSCFNFLFLKQFVAFAESFLQNPISHITQSYRWFLSRDQNPQQSQLSAMLVLHDKHVAAMNLCIFTQMITLCFMKGRRAYSCIQNKVRAQIGGVLVAYQWQAFFVSRFCSEISTESITVIEKFSIISLCDKQIQHFLHNSTMSSIYFEFQRLSVCHNQLIQWPY